MIKGSLRKATARVTKDMKANAKANAYIIRSITTTFAFHIPYSSFLYASIPHFPTRAFLISLYEEELI